jgi:predicted transcriptional regulator of viral defense system
MNQKKVEAIRFFIASQGGYIRAKTLREKGIHPSQINSLVESGALIRLKRGLYTITQDIERSELVDVQKIIPGGIYCLGTALSIHGIGTWEPPELHLAIRRDYRVAVPSSPPIRFFSFSRARFELGIEEKDFESGIIRVYDAEKTICDVIRFRNTLGMDVAMEALREYVKRQDRNIPRLLEYAKLLRMEGSIRTYLEPLL